MKKPTSKVMIPLFVLATCFFAGGCSLESFGKNVWTGFGEGLGGVPAVIVGNYVADMIAGFLPE